MTLDDCISHWVTCRYHMEAEQRTLVEVKLHEKLSKEAQKLIKLTKEYADSAVDAASDLAAKSVKQAKSLI